MYIKAIKFPNLRCFKTGEMALVYLGSKAASDSFTLENINVILAVNGSGKTTALKGMALTLIAQMEVSGFRPYSLVRRDAKEYADSAEVSAYVKFGPFDQFGRKQYGFGPHDEHTSSRHRHSCRAHPAALTAKCWY